MTTDPSGPSDGQRRPYVPPRQPPYDQQQPPYFQPPLEPGGPAPQTRPQYGDESWYRQPTSPPQTPPIQQNGWQQHPVGGPPRPPRKSHRTRNILLGIAGAVVVIIVIAVAATAGNTPSSNSNLGLGDTQNSPAATSTSSPAPYRTSTPPSGPVSLAVGQAETVEQNNDASQTASITITSITHSTQPGDSFGDPPQNGYYVIANVSASSQTNGFDINSLDFYVLVSGQRFDEGNGNAYEAVSGTPQDITTTLNNGESATGQLLFDLPTPHGQLVYAPNLNGAPLAEWSF